MNIWDILCSSRKYQYLSHLPPPPTKDNGNSEGMGEGGEGVSRRRQFPRGWEVASRVFFLGAPSKVDEQVISNLTVNRCFKAKIIVLNDDLLFSVS